MSLPLLALPLVADDVAGAYDDALPKHEASSKSWMLVERQHGKSGAWRSASVLPLDTNRTWSSTPQARLVARANAMPPTFDLRVGAYVGKLLFVWTLDPKDVAPLLRMRRMLTARDFEPVLTVELKTERSHARIGFSRDIAAALAGQDSFSNLRAQVEYRMRSIENVRSDAVDAATYCALSKAFRRCGHSLDTFRVGRA